MHSTEFVQRYGRSARWLHAVVYIGVLVDLISGWWFILGSYRPSVIAELTGIADGDVHLYAGLLLILVVLIGCGLGWRAVRTFTVESVRFRGEDLRWFRRWPRSVVSGRFEYHHGHFDPGQRLANLVMTVTLVAVLISGVGMMFLSGAAVTLFYVVHRWSTFLLTPVLLGHILIAAGILPGYRGVWRSMHLGGRLPADVARRIWPEWLDRERARNRAGE